MKEFIVVLVCFLIYFGIDNYKLKNKLENIERIHEAFGIHTATWPDGSNLLFIHGIKDYEIGFAIDVDKNLFWKQVSTETCVYTGCFINEPGKCINGKTGYRPAACFD